MLPQWMRCDMRLRAVMLCIELLRKTRRIVVGPVPLQIVVRMRRCVRSELRMQ
jgi:hypothetical protein